MQTVCIIGLGYVGLPLACLCAKKGYTTWGYDVDTTKVNRINQKKCPFNDERLQKELKTLAADSFKATSDPSIIRQCDTVIVCVPTPVDEKHMPDLAYVESAATTVAKHLKKGALVIVESTIYPGTCEEIVLPLLKKYWTTNDFFLAHCPERIDPGNKQWNVENIPRVVGGLNAESTTKAAAFYRSILTSAVTELSSIKAAEAVKIMENTFRDVNIAFINEMAMSFDKLNIDILEVIKGANTKPFAFMPHYPGTGVGGHCIPVDPYYLIEKAKHSGFEHKFLSLAREINNNMPLYTVTRLEEALAAANKKVKGLSVAVLGLAYKANVDDTRESPSYKIIDILKKRGATVLAYDPYVPQQNTKEKVNDTLDNADAVIIATDHKEFKEMPLERLKGKIVIDGKNCLDKEKVKKMCISYRGIGRE